MKKPPAQLVSAIGFIALMVVEAQAQQRFEGTGKGQVIIQAPGPFVRTSLLDGFYVVERQAARAASKITAAGDDAANAAEKAAHANSEVLVPQAAVEAGERARKPFEALKEATLKDLELMKKGEIDAAVKAAVEKAKGEGMGDLLSRAVPGAVGGALMFEPTIAMLVGAGVSDAVLKRVLPRMLSNGEGVSAFSKWALNINKTTPKKSDIAASFMALAAEAGLVESEPEREVSRPKPLSERRSERPKQFRDGNGRFASTFDHGPLEEMFRL